MAFCCAARGKGRVPVSLFLCLFFFPLTAFALQPDELLLLVNKNVPQGRALAEYYAQQRHVPAGRIVEIAMPLGDEISFENFDRSVVPVVREYLRVNKLEDQVTCIVTFFGVPLHIQQRRPSPQEQQEIAALKSDETELRKLLLGRLDDLEASAKRLEPSFVPLAGQEPAQLAQRAAAAIAVLSRHTGVATTAPATTRGVGAATRPSLVESTRFFFGPAGVIGLVGGGEQSQPEVQKLKAQIDSIHQQIGIAQEQRYDPAARATLRKLIGDGFGAIERIAILQAELDYLQSPNSTAAFDSELALLWWNYYTRTQWQLNVLFYNVDPAIRARSGKVLMACRLDAPQAGQVRDIIATCIKVENEGLKGQIVLDSRGIEAKPNEAVGSYGWYDQSIRDLATLIRAKTKLQMLHDESAAVLPPNSAANVALYCGWYSVGNYVPACRFSLGAVGFHIASFELTSLRENNPKQWVRNLINDGVVSTLGPVAEPYLHAFPRADDFFPLVLTGKFTMAEVYWKSQPLTSWMMTLIADPLYTPYKMNPALQLEDLPPRLAGHFRTVPATRPATRAN